jgi:hypothetical protein
MAKTQVSTAIDQGVYSMLEEYCARTGESKISVFERALTEWLKTKGE